MGIRMEHRNPASCLKGTRPSLRQRMGLASNSDRELGVRNVFRQPERLDELSAEGHTRNQAVTGEHS